MVASGEFKRLYRDHRLEWMVRSGGVEVVLDGLSKETIRFSRELS
jgi:glutathione S-transferase/RNA polymerase-associated protein